MLPVWHLEGCETHTMPGVSSVQVIAEAYLKGYRGFDTSEAWAAIKNTMQSDYRGMEYDREDKFIPSDKVNESVARGLEYSISNASAALMAKKMGLKDDYAAFHRRFQNYRQYWDRGTKFFRGRRADGSWDPVFDPVKSSRPWINDLSEGNHWQYLWLVPEDVEGLEKLMGGERVFTKRLDSLFLLTAPRALQQNLDKRTGRSAQRLVLAGNYAVLQRRQVQGAAQFFQLAAGQLRGNHRARQHGDHRRAHHEMPLRGRVATRNHALDADHGGRHRGRARH